MPDPTDGLTREERPRVETERVERLAAGHPGHIPLGTIRELLLDLADERIHSDFLARRVLALEEELERERVTDDKRRDHLTHSRMKAARLEAQLAEAVALNGRLLALVNDVADGLQDDGRKAAAYGLRQRLAAMTTKEGG